MQTLIGLAEQASSQNKTPDSKGNPLLAEVYNRSLEPKRQTNGTLLCTKISTSYEHARENFATWPLLLFSFTKSAQLSSEDVFPTL